MPSGNGYTTNSSGTNSQVGSISLFHRQSTPPYDQEQPYISILEFSFLEELNCLINLSCANQNELGQPLLLS